MRTAGSRRKPARLVESWQMTTESWQRGLKAVLDNQQQMRLRSGPMYELSRERSRIVGAAWRAAGSPQRPRGALTGISGTGNKLYGPPDRTSAEWQTWRGWLRKRTRLHRELRMGPWSTSRERRLDG